MNPLECPSCHAQIVPRPPRAGGAFRDGPLLVTFWSFTLLFGIGAAAFTVWGAWMLLAWLMLASSAALVLQRESSWTCPVCGAAVRASSSVPEGVHEGQVHGATV